MPVRLRITLLFLLLVMIIMGMVCGEIYYFSSNMRVNRIKLRLTSRVNNTAKLFIQSETIDRGMMQRVDSLSTSMLRSKVVEIFDIHDRNIYRYADVPGDSLMIGSHTLAEIKQNGSIFFNEKNKEILARYFPEINKGLIVISAAEDFEGRTSLRALFNILLVSFLISNTFVLLMGYFFSGRLLLPIKKIASDVEDISAQNLARRIKTGSTKDEWYTLANTLNSLLNRLQESFEFQRRFISNASHELSTPLTSISSQLEVSLQRERDAGEYRQIMESIYQDVRNMSKLTQTLLEFAKAAGSSAGLEISLIRMDEIVLRLPAEMARVNPAFSVTLEFEELPEEQESLLVFGNEILLLMAIKNIVSNACKYSDDHHAFILLKVEAKEIKVIIRDNGRGIPDAELSNIFQPFYRVKEKIESEGFGLGLSLALRIIIMHKGAIDVASKVNVGTNFTISIPAAGGLP